MKGTDIMSIFREELAWITTLHKEGEGDKGGGNLKKGG